MKKILILFLMLSCWLSVFSQDRTDSLHVAHYDIHLVVTDFAGQTVHGFADLQVVPRVENLLNIDLDLQRLTVDSVFVNGMKLVGYSHNGTLLRIPFPQVPSVGDTVLVRVYYGGTPARDSYFGGFYFSGEYCYNLGVAFRDLPHNFGRAWYPCLDFFTDKSSYDFFIETENGKMAVCGGELVDSMEVSDSTALWHWTIHDPVPTYLTSIAVGNYMHHADTVQGLERVVPIDIYIRPSDFNKIEGTFANLKNVFHIYENHYGAYPWERVGYVGVAFTGGAMEHVGNIAYPQMCINGNNTYESLYIHEFSHMWFGDLVTCNRAEEMWINEGFARYNEAVADEQLYPSDDPEADGYRKNIRKLHRGVLRDAHVDDDGYWALDSMPQAITYGTTTYDKGGLMVHALRKYMGDSIFFASLRQLFVDYPFRNISTMQLFDYLSQQSGLDLHDFREACISQPGFLHFSIDSIRSSEQAGEYRFYVRQRLSHARRFGNSNRIDVTFFSSENQRYTVCDFEFSGEFAEGTVQLPWAPVAAVVDMDEKLGDAIIDYGYDLTSTGIKNASYANFKLAVNQISQPAYFRVEDNLVDPAPLRGDNSHVLEVGKEHYWRVLCVPEGAADGGMRFAFHGGSYGNPDYELASDHGFDDIILLYRRDCTDDWHPVAAEKSGNLSTGYFSVDGIRSGEYAFGIGDGNTFVVQLPRSSDWVKVYPNPADNQLHIEITDLKQVDNCSFVIYDSNGKMALKGALSWNETLDVSNLKSGSYVIDVFVKKKVVAHARFVKK